MPQLTDLTPLAIVVIMILLTDRWVVRIFRSFTKHLERRELADQQLMLIMMQCAESLQTIKESLTGDTLLDE